MTETLSISSLEFNRKLITFFFSSSLPKRISGSEEFVASLIIVKEALSS
ncbi:hypothetical protein OIU74_028029 [Salix koriyanagi]|uniref:Uncharacterized protein n=1 Tax=Salix koriyanagi TaxID=2511006 RepID=A0A9Q0VBG1_9ROSI|nr:hypothetical protein OIU74_028029 [Salix koriyanagi]